MDYSYTTTNGMPQETGKFMYQMVETYYRDMLAFAGYTLLEIYDFIKNIPYREDSDTAEVLIRPAFLLAGIAGAGDCDDKSIALASWAYLRGIPYRFLAVRSKEKKDLHHVFPELYINGAWLTCDATYNFNSIGRDRTPFAEYVILNR
jgi:transglutaminase-like putative cysteine protease